MNQRNYRRAIAAALIAFSGGAPAADNDIYEQHPELKLRRDNQIELFRGAAYDSNSLIGIQIHISPETKTGYITRTESPDDSTVAGVSILARLIDMEIYDPREMKTGFGSGRDARPARAECERLRATQNLRRDACNTLAGVMMEQRDAGRGLFAQGIEDGSGRKITVMVSLTQKTGLIYATYPAGGTLLQLVFIDGKYGEKARGLAPK